MLRNSVEVHKLMKASELSLIPLRMMQGFDEENFLALCEALKNCAKAWSELDHIPKLGVNILIDLYPAALSCSYLYSEKEGDRMRNHIEHLGDLVRECVAI